MNVKYVYNFIPGSRGKKFLASNRNFYDSTSKFFNSPCSVVREENDEYEKDAKKNLGISNLEISGPWKKFLLNFQKIQYFGLFCRFWDT